MQSPRVGATCNPDAGIHPRLAGTASHVVPSHTCQYVNSIPTQLCFLLHPQSLVHTSPSNMCWPPQGSLLSMHTPAVLTFLHLLAAAALQLALVANNVLPAPQLSAAAAKGALVPSMVSALQVRRPSRPHQPLKAFEADACDGLWSHQGWQGLDLLKVHGLR